MEWFLGTISRPNWQPWNELISFSIVVVVCFMSFSRGTSDGVGGDFLVETDPLVKLRHGIMGLIPCRVTGKPLAVQWWKREPTAHQRTVLVSTDFIQVAIGERRGPGIYEGLYSIADDFSLIIHKVSFQDEGQYFCAVTDQTRKNYDAQTILTVFALPNEPFPTIDNCNSISSIHNRGQNCTLYDRKSAHNVTCFIDGYTPDVNISIFFRHKSNDFEVIDTSVWQNDERTIGSSVTISAKVSFYSYECVASISLKTDEIMERVAVVTARQRPLDSSEEHNQHLEKTLILVMFLVACIIPLFVFLTMMPTNYNCKDRVYLFILLMLLASLPFAMITIGTLFKNDCPVEYLIPVYLIVEGSASTFVIVIVSFGIGYDESQPLDKRKKLKDSPFGILYGTILFSILIFLPAFFMAGSVWIYRNVWPNTTDPTSPEYCHPTLYYFSFCLTTITYISIVVVLAVSINRYRKRRQKEYILIVFNITCVFVALMMYTCMF